MELTPCKQNGFVCHLYAGEDHGFTLEWAWKQSGRQDFELLQVDLKRGSQHNMLTDDGPYAGLIRAIFEDRLKGLCWRPKLQDPIGSASLYPIEGEEDAPRPIRRWGGEEYGIQDATEEGLEA